MRFIRLPLNKVVLHGSFAIWLFVWLIGLSFPFFAHSDIATINFFQILAWPITSIFLSNLNLLGFLLSSLVNLLWSLALCFLLRYFLNLFKSA
jgi:hypothetical protein